MMFFELDEDGIRLKDIKHIAQGLLHNKYVFSQLTPEQYADLAYIVTPTLASDQNEANIQARWQNVLANFTINNTHGKPMKFYQDALGKHVFFGDEAGWLEAKALHSAGHNPTLQASMHEHAAKPAMPKID